MNVFTPHRTPPHPFTQVTWTLLHPTPPHPTPFPLSGNPRPLGYIYIFDKRVQLYLGHLMTSASSLPIGVAEPHCICQFCTAVFPEYHRISHVGKRGKTWGFCCTGISASPEAWVSLRDPFALKPKGKGCSPRSSLTQRSIVAWYVLYAYKAAHRFIIMMMIITAIIVIMIKIMMIKIMMIKIVMITMIIVKKQ